MRNDWEPTGLTSHATVGDERVACPTCGWNFVAGQLIEQVSQWKRDRTPLDPPPSHWRHYSCPKPEPMGGWEPRS